MSCFWSFLSAYDNYTLLCIIGFPNDITMSEHNEFRSYWPVILSGPLLLPSSTFLCFWFVGPRKFSWFCSQAHGWGAFARAMAICQRIALWRKGRSFPSNQQLPIDLTHTEAVDIKSVWVSSHAEEEAIPAWVVGMWWLASQRRVLGRVFSDRLQKGSDTKKTKSRLGDLHNCRYIG